MTTVIEDVEAFLATEPETNQLACSRMRRRSVMPEAPNVEDAAPVTVWEIGADDWRRMQRDVVNLSSIDEEVFVKVVGIGKGNLWIGVKTRKGSWSIPIDPEAGPFIMADAQVDDPETMFEDRESMIEAKLAALAKTGGHEGLTEISDNGSSIAEAAQMLLGDPMLWTAAWAIRDGSRDILWVLPSHMHEMYLTAILANYRGAEYCAFDIRGPEECTQWLRIWWD